MLVFIVRVLKGLEDLRAGPKMIAMPMQQSQNSELLKEIGGQSRRSRKIARQVGFGLFIAESGVMIWNVRFLNYFVNLFISLFIN